MATKLAAQLEVTSGQKQGGHRAKAMTLIADAISEVQKGIKFDNAH